MKIQKEYIYTENVVPKSFELQNATKKYNDIKMRQKWAQVTDSCTKLEKSKVQVKMFLAPGEKLSKTKYRKTWVALKLIWVLDTKLDHPYP